MILANPSGFGLAILIGPHPTSEIRGKGGLLVCSFVFTSDLPSSWSTGKSPRPWTLVGFFFLMLVSWLILLCISETSSTPEKNPPILTTPWMAIRCRQETNLRRVNVLEIPMQRLVSHSLGFTHQEACDIFIYSAMTGIFPKVLDDPSWIFVPVVF